MVVRRSALQRSGDKNAPQALFKPICVQYGFGCFVTEKSKSVSSTASDRKGFVKGDPVPLDRVLVPFYTSKRNAPAASRTD